MRIVISAEEKQMLADMAHHRNDVKAGVVRNERVSSHNSDLDINVWGLYGEHAVAKVLQLRVQQNPGIGGDGGAIDNTYYGRTIQVKFNQYANGDLYMKHGCFLKADLAILTVRDGQDAVRIAGWVAKSEFDRIARPVDYGYGPCWAIPQRFLHPIEYFLPKPRHSNRHKGS